MARGHVRIRTYVDTDSRAARADGRTDRTDRETDGRTADLQRADSGAKWDALRREGEGRQAEGTMDHRVVPAMVGFGGWSAVGANSHLTNPIINN